ncbi:MMPL family transporter [Streptomyces sp. enrichment culture]|uniref:MMPL family transporter n=1 Tax=Streptomyces sp. enrichment culture TaxID=1795815 RepID=UPI003F5459CC
MSDGDTGMAGSMGRAVIRLRRLVITVAAVLTVAGGAWGAGMFDVLTPGFTHPGGEAERTTERIEDEFGRRTWDVLALYSSSDLTVDDPGFAAPVAAKAAELRELPEVARVEEPFVSEDRHARYLAVTLHGADMTTREDAYVRIADAFAVPGLTTLLGGPEAILDEVNDHADGDLARSQAITMPLLLLVLLIVLRSVPAALASLATSVLTLTGAFAVTRLIAGFTEVSTFTVNIIMILGLGLPLTHALLLITRHREHLATGAPPGEALAGALRTTGRAIALSGLTVALGLSCLLLFPQPFLRSMGYGGVATTLLATAAALTLLPALLAALGHRIAPRPPRPGRTRDSGARARRLATGIGRHPARYALPSAVLLLLLAAPVTGAVFGGTDERVLPAGTDSRVVAETIRADFPGGDPEPLHILLSGAGPAAAAEYAARLEQLDGVVAAAPPETADGAAVLRVHTRDAATSPETRELVGTIRDLPAPAGTEVLVGGAAAELTDILADIGSTLPLVLGLMAAALLAGTYLTLRSLPLAAQTLVTTALSLAASAGVLTWTFQDGPLSGPLGFTATGSVDALRPVLLLAVLFAVSTTCQLLLLSRVREEWLRTGDHGTAVTGGLRRTLPVTSAAALLLMLAVSGFAANSVAMVKIIGMGLLIGIVVEALLVRPLLAPATLHLMGRATWWPDRGRGAAPPDPGPVTAAARPREDPKETA